MVDFILSKKQLILDLCKQILINKLITQIMNDPMDF